MKKLIVFSGAAVIGIIIAAAVILNSGNEADYLFESNIRALSAENPEDVRIPCKANENETCNFTTVNADGVRKKMYIFKMEKVDGSEN